MIFRNRTAVLFLIGLALLAVSVSQSQASPDYSHVKGQIQWKAGVPLPEARSNPAVAVCGGKIFVLGGNDYNGGTDTVWVFTPGKKIWDPRKNMPVKLFCHSAVSINDRIYVMGGMNKANGKMAYSNSLYVYDPANDTWMKKADMPTARARFAAVGEKGKIYAFGGLNEKSEKLDVMEIYDISTDRWTSGEKMPTGRNRHGGVVLNGTIYAAGGCQGDAGKALDTVEAYSTGKNKWTKKSPLNTPRKNFAMVVMENKVVAAAGWDSVDGKADFFSNVEIYDPDTDKWTTINPALIKRDGSRACVLDGKIFIIGGYNGKILDAVEEGTF